MAELADALDLGSSAARHAGSTPVTRTILAGMTFVSIYNFLASVLRSIGNTVVPVSYTHLDVDKRQPFLCVGGIVMAMTIDLRLSLVIIVAIPLFVLIITLVMRKTVPLYRTVQGRLDKLTRVLRENLSGVRVIRAFARTDKEQKRFDGATEEHTAASIRVDVYKRQPAARPRWGWGCRRISG